MKLVSPKEAKALLEQGWTYLDVRSEAEFERGHPTGAVNVPLMLQGAAGLTPNPDFLRVVQAAFGKDARLVVGCQSGGRSARAARALEGAGFSTLADQRAGFGGTRGPAGNIVELGWAAEGLPVEEGQPGDRAYAALRQRS